MQKWTTLVDYLGGKVNAGNKLKEAATTHWSEDTGATNETGFTALPGGVRVSGGGFGQNGHYGYWWSSTEHTTSDEARLRYLVYSDSTVHRDHGVKRDGISVRCVKD